MPLWLAGCNARSTATQSAPSARAAAVSAKIKGAAAEVHALDSDSRDKMLKAFLWKGSSDDDRAYADDGSDQNEEHSALPKYMCIMMISRR